MDVAELIAVGPDVVGQASLIELHVVRVVEHLQHGGADEPGHLRRHPGGGQEVAHVVRGDVQGLQIHADAGIFGNLRAAAERAEHGAQLHRVGELRIAVDHPAALAQAVGVDGEGPGAQLHRRLHGPLEKIQVGVPLGRVDEGELRVPVEAGDADARVRRGAAHRTQVLVRPAPELHEVKAVGPGGPEPLREGELAVHRLDAGGSLKHHGCASLLRCVK